MPYENFYGNMRFIKWRPVEFTCSLLCLALSRIVSLVYFDASGTDFAFYTSSVINN